MPDFERIDLGVCRGRIWPGDPGRFVVTLPGASYPPAAPLLWFAGEVAQRSGWSVLEVWDELRDDGDWAADPHWDGDVARGTAGAQVLELEGADHSLQIPGDLAASLRLLGEVTSAIDRFLAEAA
jgi:hypothetical protein